MTTPETLELMKETERVALESMKEKEPYMVRVCNRPYVVMPEVFSPKYFQDTEFFAQVVPKHVQGPNFLEMGSGTGIVIAEVARNCRKVAPSCRKLEYLVAIDKNPEAAVNTQINMSLYKMPIGPMINWEVKYGDMFGPVSNLSGKDIITNGPNGEQICKHYGMFDEIFWNLPFGDYQANEELRNLGLSVFDPDYKTLKKFLRESPDYLSEGGQLLLGYSSTIGNMDVLNEELTRNGFTEAALLEEEVSTEGVLPVKFELFGARRKE
jgi:release factor glutamine methyltransferase